MIYMFWLLLNLGLPCYYGHFIGFLLLLTLFKRFYLFIFIFRQRGREGEREGEKHQCVVASHASPTGDSAATQACALSGNWTSNPLVHRLALDPLTHQPGLFVSWNRPVLLYIFLLELFWLHPIDCGSLCFHFHLSFDFFLDFVINPFVISSMLFSLHVFVCFLLVIDF